MANGFLYPIRVMTRMSPRLLVSVYGAHALALGILLNLPFSWVIRSVFAVCVIFSLYRFDARFRRRIDSRYPVEIQLNRYDEWSMRLPGGDFQPAELLPNSFVHPWLVILRFKTVRRPLAVILTPDVVNPVQLRRLRVRIKYRKTDSRQDTSINA